MNVASVTRRRLPALLSCVLLALLGCGEQAAAPARPAKARPNHEGPGRVYDKKAGISLVPPAGWTVTTPVGPGLFLTYAMPAKDGFAVNMNVNTQPLDGSTLAEGLEAIKKHLPANMPGVKIVEGKIVTLPGGQAIRLVADYPVQGKQLKLHQYYFDGERVYVLTFVAPQDQYEALQPAFEQCGESVLVD